MGGGEKKSELENSDPMIADAAPSSPAPAFSPVPAFPTPQCIPGTPQELIDEFGLPEPFEEYVGQIMREDQADEDRDVFTI